MKTIFYDTESIGFYSPTVLIQYAIGDGEIFLHDIFKRPVKETIDLIEMFMENNLVGFNLTHDHFHLSRTYGVFKMLPQNHKPEILDIADLENEAEAHDKYCLKPRGSLDLMLYGRKNELQATMNQKDIILRKVPRILAKQLITELEEEVVIPPIYFARRDGKSNWKMKDLEEETGHEITPEEFVMIREGKDNAPVIDQDFVNIRLGFAPSTGLKNIAKYILNADTDTIDNMLHYKKPEEYSWHPSAGMWVDVAMEHINGWSTDKRRRKYAIDDVVHTRNLYKYFGSPSCFDDSDSALANMVGGLHWKGYALDLPLASKQLQEEREIVKPIREKVNFNAPKQVKDYILNACNPIEEAFVVDSRKETLENLEENGSDEVSKRCREVLTGRRSDKKIDVLQKLIVSGRMYATFKVLGTKSNRMSGGSMGGSGKGGSINPQGIGKKDGLRKVFTLKDGRMDLSSGDFDGFEVSIADAVYNDEALRKDLLSGKSIHALWGASLYKMSYDDIYATKEIAANEPNGFYSRAKNSFFAQLYGAQTPKIAEITGLSEDEVFEAKKHFEEKYVGVEKARLIVYDMFEAMHQPDGIGSAIMWKEPDEFAESFLGFRRYFTMEFKVVKALYDIANNPTEDMKRVGQLIKVKRRDRIQTGYGALQSSVYAGAFNLQASVIRAAQNHMIQSPGGQITKELQNKVWGLQPTGIYPWVVMPMNIHDELQCPHLPEVTKEVEDLVNEFVEDYKDQIPMIGMTWKTNLDNWGDK